MYRISVSTDISRRSTLADLRPHPQDFGETIATWKLLDGSGRGDRENGEFGVLEAQQTTRQPDRPNQSKGPSWDDQALSGEEAEQEWDAIEGELREEQVGKSLFSEPRPLPSCG